MSIVVGFSEKPEGLSAIRAAIVEARVRGARLVVVPTGAGEDPRVATDELARGGIDDFDVAETGEPDTVAERVLAEAERVRASMIVIGLRRRSPTGKLLLGANAQRVLLDAPCPVLAVKSGDENA